MGLGMMLGGVALIAGSLFVYAVSGIGEPPPPHALRNAEIGMAFGAGIGIAGVPVWFTSTTSVEVH